MNERQVSRWRQSHQDLIEAAFAASAQLAKEEVAHCLVGRLGLALHGFDPGDVPGEVSFLLDEDSAFYFPDRGKVRLTRVSLPLSVGGVIVKWCSFEHPWEKAIWDVDLGFPDADGDSNEPLIPLAPLSLILCTLMLTGDEVAVSSAVRDEVPTSQVLATLQKHSPREGARLAAIIANSKN
jgi:hypothetical protein